MGMFASISALARKSNDNKYLVRNNTSISDTKIKKKKKNMVFTGWAAEEGPASSRSGLLSPPKVIGPVDYHATQAQTMPYILKLQKVSLCFLQREHDKHVPSWMHLGPPETWLQQSFCLR